MNSLSEFLLDSKNQVVVVVMNTNSESRVAAQMILEKYVDMGGSVMSPGIYNYRLSDNNKLIFINNSDERRMIQRIKGVKIDVILFSSNVRPFMSTPFAEEIKSALNPDFKMGVLEINEEYIPF